MDRREIASVATGPLFRGVEVEEVERLLGGLSLRRYGGGSLLLLAGCSYDSLLVLVEGSVEAEMGDLSGRSIRIETIAAPEAIATAVLFAPDPVLPVTVRALEETRVLALPRDLVLDLCQKSRAFLRNYLADSGARLAAFSERFRLLTFSSLRERLADWLLRQSYRSGGGEITLPSSKEKLAETFGVARPSLSRELLAMERDGLIEMEGRRIALLEPSALRELLSSGRRAS